MFGSVFSGVGDGSDWTNWFASMVDGGCGMTYAICEWDVVFEEDQGSVSRK
jgi:hypothetical protein